MLLALPLQGHARMASDTMPCDMAGHAQSVAMPGMMDEQSAGEHSSCLIACDDCAACGHLTPGVPQPLQTPASIIMPGSYVAQAVAAYTSITLYREPPPPRFLSFL